jgi:hypothetical protein
LDVSYAERQSIVLIDLQDITHTRSPRVILDLYGSAGDARDRPSSLGSVFVQEGPFAGDIVLTQFLGDRTSVQLLDVARGGQFGRSTRVVARATVDYDSSYQNWQVDHSPEDGLLIVGHEFVPYGGARKTTFSIVDIAVGEPAEVREAAISVDSYLVSVCLGRQHPQLRTGRRNERPQYAAGADRG